MLDHIDAKSVIAKRVARELQNGQLVNLGIGLPTLVANYLPEGVSIMLQSENGMVGMDKAPLEGQENKHLTNAGGAYVTLNDKGAFFDSSVSFGLIRGGHVDVTVLGALEVDQYGNIANWIIPGKLLPGMGGAMDLLTGAKKVIVAMQHTAKGSIKILEKCTLPLTAANAVHEIVTEYGVMLVTDKGLELIEIHPETTVEEIQSITGCKLIVSENLKTMEF